MHHPTRDGAFARTVINGMHSRIPCRAPVWRDGDAEDQPDIPWVPIAVVLILIGPRGTSFPDRDSRAPRTDAPSRCKELITARQSAGIRAVLFLQASAITRRRARAHC